MSEKRFN